MIEVEVEVAFPEKNAVSGDYTGISWHECKLVPLSFLKKLNRASLLRLFSNQVKPAGVLRLGSHFELRLSAFVTSCIF